MSNDCHEANPCKLLTGSTLWLERPGNVTRSFSSDLLLLVAGMAIASCLSFIMRLIRENDSPRSTEPREAQFSAKGEPVEWVNMCWRKVRFNIDKNICFRDHIVHIHFVQTLADGMHGNITFGWIFA
eukprot:scaffold161837_cov27-Prasinocladus_malaysianus.AAC.1